MPLSFAFPRITRRATRHALIGETDGDTLVIDQPVRMVSIDTCEKAGYAGGPAVAQAKLDRCRQRLQDGTLDALPQGLRDHLAERLAPTAAQRHIDAGIRATAEFEALRARRLTRPDGTTRRLASIPTGDLITTDGRLLAYLAPWYANTPADPLPPLGDPARATFNLNLVESGWAALFLVYPSLPNNPDLNRIVDAAQAAWDAKAGMWSAFGADLLLGYEYRACIKLAAALDDPEHPRTPADLIADAYQRVCVDLRTLTEVGKFGYFEVPPSQRLWFWETDQANARRDLNLQAS
jgi:endonuclease YncB( thermonuclease family)